MKKVTIGVILFGTKYLKESLPTLLDQNYPEIEFIFRDQEEGEYSAYEYIKKELPDVFKKAKIEKGENLWHGGGHNAIINKMKGDYYFCCSNDMIYPPDFVTKIMEALKKNPKFTAATCKLKQWDYVSHKMTNIIDSFGIGCKEHHHFYDIGQGQEDKGQFDHLKQVWGVSGALCVLSKEALDAIKYQDEYYDALLHYKNDVDLSYRLQWAGQKALFIKDVTVFHDRQVASHTKKTLWMKQSSFFGEKIMMRKNFSNQYPWKIKLKTYLYHFIKTCFLLITTPKLFKEYKKIKKHKQEIAEKKAAINRSNSIKNIIKLMG